MGETITRWRQQVVDLVKDSDFVDTSLFDVDEVGIVPALNLYSIDQPRLVVVEQAGTGSPYLSLPSSGSGWVPGFSQVESIEYPARQNPPRVVDSQLWTTVRSVADVAVEQVLLLGATPSSSEHVRITFSSSWPTPTDDASVDQVDSIGFSAVCYLAASCCLQQLAAEASKSRMGSLPTSFADGAQRSKSLRDQAKEYRSVYDRFLGRTSSAGGESGPGPSSRPFDYDPGYNSMFHGRRR
jgi:hypothetical protein